MTSLTRAYTEIYVQFSILIVYPGRVVLSRMQPFVFFVCIILLYRAAGQVVAGCAEHSRERHA